MSGSRQAAANARSHGGSINNDELRLRAARARLDRSSQGAYRMLGTPDEQIAIYLRLAHRDLGERALTATNYQRWRRERLERFDEPIPARYQLTLRYGSFTEALWIALPELERRGLRLASPAQTALRGGAGPCPTDPSSEGPTSESKYITATNAGVASDRTVADSLRSLLAMVDSLPEPAQRELERALRRRLAPYRSSAAQRRVGSLGFLAELLSIEAAAVGAGGSRGPTLVPRIAYDAARPRSAPTSERLVRLFGSWFGACRAAEGVVAGGRKSAPGTVAGRTTRAARQMYSREEVLAAVRLCAQSLGRVPSSCDYHAWALERKARARATGTALRLPGYSVFCRLFRGDGGSDATVWSRVLGQMRDE